MGKKLLPFRWYGGKYSHLDWLLPLLPKTEQYIEPFGGSAAVLINREPSPVETYNDIDSDVTNFFNVLRENKNELLEKVALTPFSREELAKAVEQKDNDELSDIERARLFFVRAGQTRSGLAQEATPGRWAYCKSTSRRNMSGAVSRWHGRLEHLDEVAKRLRGEQFGEVADKIDEVIDLLNQKNLEGAVTTPGEKNIDEALDALHSVANRLRRVQIENKPAIEVIQRHSDENSLFYCDPPYPHEVRGDTNSYGFEMSDEEHRELAEVLHECEGKVAISSYQCDLMEELYGDWMRIDAPEKTMHTTKDTRQESLWVNYDLPERDIEGITVHQPTLGEFPSSE